MQLTNFFKNNPKCALGFSGGVDSAYLLFKAKELGVDIKPYFVHSAFTTQCETESAVEFSKQLGFELTVIEADVISVADIVKNGTDRCYHCKKHLFETILNSANRDGYFTVLEGTNASDDIDDRPGYKAICELGILSPLKECGITKDSLRNELKASGVSIWNKPSTACLATRITTGDIIRYENLKRAENAEVLLSAMGFSDFRVRVFNDAARLQLPSAQLEAAVLKRNEIVKALAPYFKDVLLDLRER